MQASQQVKQDAMTVEYYGLQIVNGFHMEEADWELYDQAVKRLTELLQVRNVNLENPRKIS